MSTEKPISSNASLQAGNPYTFVPVSEETGKTILYAALLPDPRHHPRLRRAIAEIAKHLVQYPGTFLDINGHKEWQEEEDRRTQEKERLEQEKLNKLAGAVELGEDR